MEPTADAQAKGSESLDTFKHVRQVQLFTAYATGADTRKMLGRMVVVVGTLRQAVAPGEHTKVTMMDVKTIGPK